MNQEEMKLRDIKTFVLFALTLVFTVFVFIANNQ